VCFQAADRSSSGLLEFEHVGDALIALMLCNHAPIQNPGKYYNYIEHFDICIGHNEFAFYVLETFFLMHFLFSALRRWFDDPFFSLVLKPDCF
jgi:hypothetical protein